MAGIDALVFLEAVEPMPAQDRDDPGSGIDKPIAAPLRSVVKAYRHSDSPRSVRRVTEKCRRCQIVMDVEDVMRVEKVLHEDRRIDLRFAHTDARVDEILIE
jgi:hypothetical protein